MSYSETITRTDLTNILNQVLTASSGMSVEDISDKITFGSAWSNLHRKAYLIGGKFVFFTLEGYAGTIVAGTQYTIATIASGYRPKDTEIFTGHATNSSYVPQSVVNCYVWTSGDITVRCSNANGNYVFINGWYALAEGSAPIIVADYIVEQGTSGDWIYRKWNSGIAECWCKITGTWSVNFTSQASGVYSATGWNANQRSLPSGLFTSVTSASGSVQTSGYTSFQVSSLTTSTITFRAWNSYAVSGMSIYSYTLDVKGRWK